METDTFARHVLDSLRSGVAALCPPGRVIPINPASARILALGPVGDGHVGSSLVLGCAA